MDNYLRCFEGNYCISLANGKLYTCSVAAWVYHFMNYFHVDLKYTHESGSDIYKAKNKKEIYEFLAGPDAMCRHCNLAERTNYHPWRQSKREISEWS